MCQNQRPPPVFSLCMNKHAYKNGTYVLFCHLTVPTYNKNSLMTHIITYYTIWRSITEDRNIIICLTNPLFVRHLFSIFHYNQSYNNYSCSYLCTHPWVAPQKKKNLPWVSARISYFKNYCLLERWPFILPATTQRASVSQELTSHGVTETVLTPQVWICSPPFPSLPYSLAGIRRLVLAKGKVRRSKVSFPVQGS